MTTYAYSKIELMMTTNIQLLLLFADEKKIGFDFFFSPFFELFFSFLSRGTSRDGTGQPVKIPARPVPWYDFELVPLSLCPEKLDCPVPLETLPQTSGKMIWSFHVSFFRGLQSVLFCLMINSCISQQKTSSLQKNKTRKFREKKNVDSGIVKTCDELDLVREFLAPVARLFRESNRGLS